MKPNSNLLLPFACAISLLLTVSSSAQVQIVVNFGPHPSAEVAARSEAKVNWLDADTADDTVCTECFAAVELQSYLRKLTGRTTDFAIVDDDAATQGELILVGGPASNAVARKLAARDGRRLGVACRAGARGLSDRRRAKSTAAGHHAGRRRLASRNALRRLRPAASHGLPLVRPREFPRRDSASRVASRPST